MEEVSNYVWRWMMSERRTLNKDLFDFLGPDLCAILEEFVVFSVWGERLWEIRVGHVLVAVERL
jgi:hypothetical protein